MSGETIQLCEGCEPLTPAELYALYMLTGEHPAADEVVQSVRRKLSHTFLDLQESTGKTTTELVGDDYYNEWLAEKSFRCFATNPESEEGSPLHPDETAPRETQLSQKTEPIKSEDGD